MTPAEVDAILTVPPEYQARRGEVASAVVTAVAIVRDFALHHRWSRCVEEPFFHRIEIYRTQDALWRRMLALNEAEDLPMPTDALTAGLEKGVLLALIREEAERARPEYFSTRDDWTRAFAHEMVHQLHVRILNGQEERMGPQWFFEAFAVIGSGQALGQGIQVRNVDEAVRLTEATGRGSYAQYAAALRYFTERIPLPQLVERAAAADFQAWLRRAGREKSKM
jgi:hypothetical protein